MADEHEKGEDSNGFRDTIEKYKGKAKRLVANDGVSKSEKEVFESQQEALELQMTNFEIEKRRFCDDKMDFRADKAMFSHEKSAFMVEKATFIHEKAIFMAEKAAFIDKEIDEEIEKEFLWREEETRERVVEGREVVFNEGEKEFLDFTRGVMYRKMGLGKERVRAKMRDIEKVLASWSGFSYSIQLYSQLDEQKHSPLCMTEAQLELRPSVEREFA